MERSFSTSMLSDRMSYAEMAALAAKCGFTALDCSLENMIRADSPFMQENWKEYTQSVLADFRSAGLTCNQTHTPFSFGRTAYLDKTVYEERVFPALVRSIEISGMLGAKVAVVHPLHYYHNYADKEDVFRQNMDFYRTLLPYAEEYGVKIAVENMWDRDPRTKYITHDTCSRKEEFARYVDELDSPYAVACLDIGHVGLAPQEDEVWDVIRHLGRERLQALHIHDNDYIGDLHGTVYSGKIDWRRVTQALGEIDYRGDFTYEVGPAYFRYMEDEFIPVALRYIGDVAKHLQSRIDACRG